MKPVTKKLIITVIYTIILFIIVLIGPQENKQTYDEYVSNNVSYNFLNTYKDIDEFNIKNGIGCWRNTQFYYKKCAISNKKR